jgi:hypothetical protein
MELGSLRAHGLCRTGTLLGRFWLLRLNLLFRDTSPCRAAQPINPSVRRGGMFVLPTFQLDCGSTLSPKSSNIKPQVGSALLHFPCDPSRLKIRWSRLLPRQKDERPCLPMQPLCTSIKFWKSGTLACDLLLLVRSLQCPDMSR